MPSLPGIRDSVALSLSLSLPLRHSMRYRDGLLPHISSPLCSSLFPPPLPLSLLHSALSLFHRPGISVEMKFDNLHSIQPSPANLSLSLFQFIGEIRATTDRTWLERCSTFSENSSSERSLIDALSPRSSIITFDYICYSRSAEPRSRGFGVQPSASRVWPCSSSFPLLLLNLIPYSVGKDEIRRKS